MDYSSVTLNAYKGITFKASLTITANGVPTNVGDRTFKAQARSKGLGPIAFPITVTVADQGQFPGRIDLSVSTDVLSKVQLEKQAFGMSFPTPYIFDVACTYLASPTETESVAGGTINIYPTAL